MEFIFEGIAIGLDALILGLLFKSYESCSAYIDALKVTIIWQCYLSVAVCHQLTFTWSINHHMMSSFFYIEKCE